MQVIIESGHGIHWLITLCGAVTHLVSENNCWPSRLEGDDNGDNEEEEVPPEKKVEVQR
jgi:hypothetical protein